MFFFFSVLERSTKIEECVNPSWIHETVSFGHLEKKCHLLASFATNLSFTLIFSFGFFQFEFLCSRLFVVYFFPFYTTLCLILSQWSSICVS